MSKRKHKRPSLGAYVAVPKRITDAPAWRVMSPWARLVWINARAWLRNDWSNNGTTLHRSCREAAKAIGCSKDTAMVSFAENVHFGFMRETAPGFLGSDGYGIATHWRFTDLPCGTHPPTREYEEWDGSPFVYPGRRRLGSKKQNPVLNARTPCPQRSDIRRVRKRGSVSPQRSDIIEGARCPQRSDISSLPPPTAAPDHEQGSSTARAPVQAGDVGSSPAPVAKRTWLTPKSTDPEPKGEVIDLPPWAEFRAIGRTPAVSAPTAKAARPSKSTP